MRWSSEGDGSLGIGGGVQSALRVFDREAQHRGRDIATVHAFDAGHVEAAEAVACLHPRAERDACFVAGEAHAHAGAETQVAVVGACLLYTSRCV